MATIYQVRGLILEEVILALLRSAGFNVVQHAGTDPTLSSGPSGLRVLGRGVPHQADAVADFRFCMPFGYPSRLIVEAKCFTPDRPVKLPVIQNAVGVLKDINEYFVPVPHAGYPSRLRYHYRYAVFSATRFSPNAQRYAFAHDIYLFQLERSGHMRPIIEAIRRLGFEDFGGSSRSQIQINFAALRRSLRRSIGFGQVLLDQVYVSPRAYGLIERLVHLIHALGGSLLGLANRQFPLHLVPSRAQVLEEVAHEGELQVRIRYDQESWYLYRRTGSELLFSFDLPDELFEMYAESGVLSPMAALDMKERELGQIEALYTQERMIRHILFRLDPEWMSYVRSRLRRAH
jgi:hypothetical protein